jgi:hypothetical protein
MACRFPARLLFANEPRQVRPRAIAPGHALPQQPPLGCPSPTLPSPLMIAVALEVFARRGPGPFLIG